MTYIITPSANQSYAISSSAIAQFAITVWTDTTSYDFNLYLCGCGHKAFISEQEEKAFETILIRFRLLGPIRSINCLKPPPSLFIGAYFFPVPQQ